MRSLLALYIKDKPSAPDVLLIRFVRAPSCTVCQTQVLSLTVSVMNWLKGFCRYLEGLSFEYLFCCNSHCSYCYSSASCIPKTCTRGVSFLEGLNIKLHFVLRLIWNPCRQQVAFRVLGKQWHCMDLCWVQFRMKYTSSSQMELMTKAKNLRSFPKKQGRKIQTKKFHWIVSVSSVTFHLFWWCFHTFVKLS